MRHRNFGKKLGRTHNQRQALFKTMARQLFTYGAIETTAARSTAVKPFVEKLARQALQNNLRGRRELFAAFQDRTLVNTLSTKFAAVFADHHGTFLKEINIKRRQGDDALIVKLSLVKPFNLAPEEKKTEVKVEKKADAKIKKVVKAKAVKEAK